MSIFVMIGLLLPFLGTTAGSACVLFMKNEIRPGIQKLLLGFAGGVMTAAAVWSLLIPSMEMSAGMGKMAFLPAAGGFAAGIVFLLFMDRIIPHLHLGNTQPEGPKSSLKKTTMLILAVTLHNIPEGMAAGVVLAGAATESAQITLTGALALSVGIAIQNFPEGAVVSMPLRSEGTGRKKAFLYGTLSGIVEPIAGILTILFAGLFLPVLPVLLSFAAGAMIYVVVEELIPEANEGAHSNIGTLGFAAGFLVMMVLDTALG